MTVARGLVRERGLLLSAAALFLLLSIAYAFSIGMRASRGASISGDEPFYLLTTQSLLQDGDLDLVNQYEERSYEAFFDHPDGLWKQSVPTADGRLLSPHNPGLSVLLIPGFALGGLVGSQVQLLLMAAAAMALAFLLAERLTGRRWLCWAMTLAVGLSATAFVYSTEVYPEFPAALALLLCLLVVTARPRVSPLDGLYLAAVLSAVCWLGVKYAPLVLLIAGCYLYRADGRGRAALLALGGASAAAFIWFHVAVFEGLTPYNVNVVYAGLSSIELVDRHAELGDRVYRLWGLFVDRRFGVGRWAPILLVAAPGLAALALRNGPYRLVFGLIAVQLLIATFLAITMMGWWFPGRTLLAVLPAAGHTPDPGGGAGGPDGAGGDAGPGHLQCRHHRWSGASRTCWRGDHGSGPLRHELSALQRRGPSLPQLHLLDVGDVGADSRLADRGRRCRRLNRPMPPRGLTQ